MTLPATIENIQLATEFLLSCWRERCQEYGREKIPNDLSGACIFCSEFVEQVFGAARLANWHHSWNVLPDGSILDLSSGSADVQTWLGAGIPVYEPDQEFMCRPEFIEKVTSVRPRMTAWVERFLSTVNEGE